MSTPTPSDFSPEDFGKQYQIVVNLDDEPQGAQVYIHLVGTFENGTTNDVDHSKVIQFELGAKMPFSILNVPSSCELIAVQ
jgi:hypothetical protein